jgi:hypothetical protein
VANDCAKIGAARLSPLAEFLIQRQLRRQRVPMKPLIFSHFYERPGASSEPNQALKDTLDIWLDHLRGPGAYEGDVILYTNVAGIRWPDLIVRPFDGVPADPRRAHLHRALSYRIVPVQQYDVVMQMDLDLLAVDDINPLFPTDRQMWAAPSDACTLDWRHAWTLLPRWRRRFHKLFGWRTHELGVSACVVASAAETFEKNFGAWARVIEEHDDREIPHLADQSFLNLVYFKRLVPMTRWDPTLICHQNWEAAVGARVLHFPCSRRSEMQRFVKVRRRLDPVGALRDAAR